MISTQALQLSAALYDEARSFFTADASQKLAPVMTAWKPAQRPVRLVQHIDQFDTESDHMFERAIA